MINKILGFDYLFLNKMIKDAYKENIIKYSFLNNNLIFII